MPQSRIPFAHKMMEWLRSVFMLDFTNTRVISLQGELHLDEKLC